MMESLSKQEAEQLVRDNQMQREIIKDLLGEKLAREQHQTELNDALQRRLQETTASAV